MFVLKVLSVFLLGIILCNGKDINITGTVVVQTNNGKVQGTFGERTSEDQKLLYWFRSIPYAEPPIGDLRFEAPVAKKRWSGILDVSEKSPHCIQGSSPPSGSEDCLYLKVYTNKEPNPKNNLPVMVYIYGGGFFAGYADFDDHSPDYLLDEDVIVVAIHFRIGFLAFMSTGDTVAPGNNGIRDQILGLKWIKENIKNFGGDPERITIFGQSAGSASVGYLLQIGETKGLFSGAILQSGSTLSPWALATGVPKVTRAIARKLKVATTNSSTILEGLKKVDIETLQNEASSRMGTELLTGNPLQGLVYAPVAEPEHKNAIITAKSHELLKNGSFHHVPLLVGYTSLEGYFQSLPAIFRLWLARYDANPVQLLPDDMNANIIMRLILGNRIKLNYFGLGPVATSSKRLMRFVADTQFEKPIQEAIRLYSQKTKVYSYHFNYRGPLWGRYNRTVDAVGHTEDLGYIFDFGHKGSDADYLTRHRMVRLWTNFAKNGDPTPVEDSLLQNVRWPANEGSDNLQFLEIDKDISVTGLPNDRNINFWRRLYTNYGRPPFSTY